MPGRRILIAAVVAIATVFGNGFVTEGFVADEPIVFNSGFLSGFEIAFPTSLAFGPDERLYVSQQDGRIVALTIDHFSHTVLGVEEIASADGLQDVLGVAFNPADPPGTVVLYVSNTILYSSGDPYPGRITRLAAPDWTPQDIITGLPSSATWNHTTNGLAFDSAGKLYIAQGSSTNDGLPLGLDRPETPLTAAILVADIDAPGFDGDIVYNPPGEPTDDNINKVSGDVQVFAAGLRNPYDLVFHSNGHIYATDNGPGASSGASVSCTESGPAPSAADELNLIAEGNYYGFPNRNRGRIEPRQCVYHAPEEPDGIDFTGPIAVLPAHCSCDGIVEYTAPIAGGKMAGDLIYAEWGNNRVTRVVLSPDGASVTSTTELVGGLVNPLDVTVGPDGTIYIAEHGAGIISYLVPATDFDGDGLLDRLELLLGTDLLDPDSDGDGCGDGTELGDDETLGGQRDPLNSNDFFDVPLPPGPPGTGAKNGAINIFDALGVLAKFGTHDNGTPDDFTDDPPNTGGQVYNPDFDRTLKGSNAWNSGPPDGAINIFDVLRVLAQFGHSCLGPP